mmetsp:Transcript_41827/g.81782  ORF Transcript_41827/g.81782 Transcript_41827/m.81782 type:complete len:125 (-) Transcript_41827:261-635(-)|eukprot:CAMPEP_0173391682 /NCGR_PEP_ID=MMETSP1356-20130122/18522_1 /TAXON_ID=77927 ORGANISM="Hemiselmis virescens, Strain PCC157" /NCGR_SAMPLE_ID=MMETSP1356 /ASSEMBLY_ACC=CAM_ASM_000847 /LENGTH=124 /DNA_ID=CAMNT_0014349347 /DNA_START=175 /DNA_END=549 /DNA_ORIENTATION=+
MSNLILNVVCSVSLSVTARTTLMKKLSANASKALQRPAEDLTLILNSDSGMMVEGKFGPAALVQISSTNPLAKADQAELATGLAAAFREGLPMEPNRIKFLFQRNLIGSADVGWEGAPPAEGSA